MARYDYLQDMRPRKARREMQRLDPQAAQLGLAPRPRVARQTQSMPAGNMSKVVDQGNTTNNAIEASVYNMTPKYTDGAKSREDRSGGINANVTPIERATQAVDNLSKPYNPEADPFFNQLAEYQEGKLAEQFAARGMEYSSGMKERIGQMRTYMGLDFANRYRQQQLDVLGGAQTLQRMDVTQRAEDVGQYGLSLSPEARVLTRTAETLTPDEWSFADQYKQDYAAAMQNFEPGTREYEILSAARFNKVMADPSTYAEYLTRDYGMSPQEVETMVQDQLLADAERNTTDEKAKLELEKLRTDLATKQISLEEAVMKMQYLPDELKMKYLTGQYNLQKAKTDASLKAESLRKALASSDPMVKNAFLSWSKNGVSINEWLQTKTSDGRTIGDKLSKEVIDGMTQMARDQGLIQSKDSPLETALMERLLKTMGGETGAEE